MKDDAISRQAVLKLLATMSPEEATTKAMLIQSVKQMDAAQPEIIRCRECEYGKWDIGDRGMYCGRKHVELDTYEDFFCAAANRREVADGNTD